MKKIKGFLIMAGHLDIEWYQPMRSYRFWTVETLDRLIENAKGSFPAYTLDGQVFPLEEYLEIAPESEQDMRRLIAEGRLAVGPFYTQFDEWLPSAENMIRNCLFGLNRAKALGRRMRAGYLPDNFGHPRQLPQILNGFGLDSLLFMRGMPEKDGGHPDEFMYEGIDGSTIMTSHFREGYGGAFDLKSSRAESLQPREVPYYPDYLSFEHHVELSILDSCERVAQSMIDNVRKRADRYPSHIVPLVAGGDHMPPQIGLDKALELANNMCDDIEFVSGTAEEYIEAIRPSMTGARTYSDELIGSRFQNILFGALSTRCYLKRMNFGCEALLEKYAEPLQAYADMEGMKVRHTYLEEAWRNMLINSAHDSIHGSSVDEVHTEMEARFAAVRQTASGVIHESLAYLGADADRSERRIVTWAGAKNNGPQLNEVWLNIGDNDVQIADERGRMLPTQITKRVPPFINGRGLPGGEMYPGKDMRRVLFTADNEFGKIDRFTVKPRAEITPMLHADDTHIENEYLSITVRGALIDITDKRTGRQYRGLNLLREEADAGDAWDWSPSWTECGDYLSTQFGFTSKLVESGCVRSTIEISGKMLLPQRIDGDVRSTEKCEMPVKFSVSLIRGVPRADVRCEIDNTVNDHRVRLCVDTGIIADNVLSQGHLAVIERPVERITQKELWYQPPTQLVPMREWAAVKDGNVGLAIAIKGVYDYESRRDPLTMEVSLAFTLLRGIGNMGRINMRQRKGSASMSVPTPGAECRGPQTIEWSFIPFDADTENGLPFVQEADSFLFPPVTHAVRTIDKVPSCTPDKTLYTWNADNIRFSAFKQSYDCRSYVLRVYEDRGIDTQFELLTEGFSKAYEAELDESRGRELEISVGRIRLHAAPYKAITIILEK